MVEFTDEEFNAIERQAKIFKLDTAKYLRLIGIYRAYSITPLTTARTASQLEEMMEVLSQMMMLIEQYQLSFLNENFLILMQEDLQRLHGRIFPKK